MIAFALHVSQKTVETHRARVMKKLDAASFADLIRYYFMAFGRSGRVPKRRRAPRKAAPLAARLAATRN